MTIDDLKRQAAERAVEQVQSGMVVGLGHGSTAIYAVRRIGALIQVGTLKNVLGIPCSQQIELEARKLDIPITTLEENPVVDLTIDGADEVDPHLEVIKGGGGALLREKIVAQASTREIIVVDESKLSPALCTRFALPIEVIPFGWTTHLTFLESLGGRPKQRMASDGSPFKTDQGNFIIDCKFDPLTTPAALAELAEKIKARVGIVEHGFFIGIASEVIVAGTDRIRNIRR
ncbi:MAG: ribose-5-phosphate isomerase RpiA [Anaerolineae bacterium]|nr:MAG: ribose-5-phosphate isomerase RpiA [Anaerolineae bacterium]